MEVGGTTGANKSIMVSYNDLNKIIKLSHDADIQLLKERCLHLFKFGPNIKLFDLIFQKYDPDWDAYVDLTYDDFINHKDKLKMVVQPLLKDQSVASSLCDFNEVSFVLSKFNFNLHVGLM